jgi:hypothetical protein
MVKLDDTSLPRFSFYHSNWGRLRKQNIKHAKLGQPWRHPVVAAPGLDLEVLGKGSLSQSTDENTWCLNRARRADPAPLGNKPLLKPRVCRDASSLDTFRVRTRLACLLCRRRAFSKCELPHTPRPIPERCWRAWADGLSIWETSVYQEAILVAEGT